RGELERLEEKIAKSPGSEHPVLQKGVDNYKRDIRRMGEKLAEIGEERQDYGGILDLYTDLFKMWIKDNNITNIHVLVDKFGDLILDDYDLYKQCEKECKKVRKEAAVEWQKRIDEDMAAYRKKIAEIDKDDSTQSARLKHL